MTSFLLKFVLKVCILMSIFNLNGNGLTAAYNIIGSYINSAYDLSGNNVFTIVPVPSGNLNASEVIELPDIHNTGHGWTCTGLAYDIKSNTFLIGDIGKATPSTPEFASQIIRVHPDFETIVEQIPLYTKFPNMSDIQGIAIDTSNDSIWFCSSGEGKVRNITQSGTNRGVFDLSSASGIAYSSRDDSLWILVTNTNEILKVSKSGTVKERYAFGYNETVDQCFLDESRGLLYITAGANYSARNNIYCFNINTHEQYIACIVDSYAVEGIWLGDTDKMIILNDGYYHSAYVGENQVNIYTIE